MILLDGEKKMNERKRTDTNSSGPIHLDMEQIEELDKLIQNLKKEVIAPEKKSIQKTVTSAEAERA
jgi:hypothetical protein